MRKFLVPVLLLALIFPASLSAETGEDQTPAVIEGSQWTRYSATTGLLDFVRFHPGQGLAPAELEAFAKKHLNMGPNDELRAYQTWTDRIGFTHTRYRQYYNNNEVSRSMVIVHEKNGEIISINGEFYPIDAQIATLPSLSESAALDAAKMAVGAQLYKWEVPIEEEYIKLEFNDPTATFFPTGELSYAADQAGNMHLTWKFDIYAENPSSRADVFIDALTGEEVFRKQTMHDGGDHVGTAITEWNGTQSIMTDSLTNNYVLADSTRGEGVFTRNMENRTNFGSSVHFTDNDNTWNNINADLDQVATDAHWGAEMFYDYFDSLHGRSSYDGQDGAIRIFVHYGNNFDNATWDGVRARFGDGGGNSRPVCVLDVVAHEMAHGVTGTSADLIYAYESGALNESFSDIFGLLTERYAQPTSWNWIIGEEWVPGGIRSFINPGAFGDPDTYLGSNYRLGTADNGGVHSNSAVQNHWFYRLVAGGSGTNDNQDQFSVNGIGAEKAGAIAYRNLNTYLSPSSSFSDARYFSIQAAIDLYGACSNEMQQTMNAWHAVGIGSAYDTTTTAAFTASKTNFCNTPATVDFTNTTTGGAISYLWKFGDGATSTDVNPSHTYNFASSYNITLIATTCNGVSDTLFEQEYVIVDFNQPCEILMPSNSSTDVEACEGFLKDSGGNDDYLDNNTSYIHIAPPGATNITLNFTDFDFATSGDYIAIYDGPDDQSPTIGLYNGTALPNGGVITSTGGSLTIKEVTNGFNSFPGFSASWSCFVSVDPTIEAFQNLSIFPNPAQDQLNIVFDFDGTEDLSVEIVDLFGKVQMQSTDRAAKHFETEMNIAELAAGIYMVRLTNGEATLTRKIVIQ